MARPTLDDPGMRAEPAEGDTGGRLRGRDLRCRLL